MCIRDSGQSFFRGRLGGVEDGKLLIDADDGRQHRVGLNLIRRGNLEVEF